MHWCDRNVNVLEWGSEEIIIPYRSPLDNRTHRYYPDFYVRARTKDGRIAKSIIEIKPAAQTKPPKRKSQKARTFITEVKTWNDEGNSQCESCLRLICTLCQDTCDSNHVLCIDCVTICSICSNDRMKEQNKEKKWI